MYALGLLYTHNNDNDSLEAYDLSPLLVWIITDILNPFVLFEFRIDNAVKMSTLEFSTLYEKT